MRQATVTDNGAKIRWVELPGAEPARVYLHGIGASSPPYYAAVASDPRLREHRSLLLDLLGFGLSDRPCDMAYTLEEHADTVARALGAAAVSEADLIAHSMGGAVAIVLAARHPELVSNLVLIDANIDPYVPVVAPGSSGIATYSEREFVTGGWQEVRDRVGEHWWATMRLAGLQALHRSAVHLARGTTPTMRQQLCALAIPRTFLHPAGDEPARPDELRAAGIKLVAIEHTGHNIMLDNPEAFIRATAAALNR
jgi:pimeloyl-ACP methyl ester carboxylesterase